MHVQPVYQSIHTLYERLNAEQDVTRGIDFGETEMEREQGGESPITGNTESYQAGTLETLEKKAEH